MKSLIKTIAVSALAFVLVSLFFNGAGGILSLVLFPFKALLWILKLGFKLIFVVLAAGIVLLVIYALLGKGRMN